MNDYPVNIADFRCRTVKFRANHSPARSLSSQSGLALVVPHRREDSPSQQPRVYDIGVAREAQRMRHRVLFRPISIQRRAKILRFHEAPMAHAAVHAVPQLAPTINGPYDLPPAA